MKKEDLKKENNPAAKTADAAEPLAPIEAATLTPEQLDELKKTAAKADEFKDNWLRTAADLENYRKRAAREKIEAIQFANAGLIQKLLPVLDNFEMAMAAAQNAKDQNASSLQAGVAMIQSQLKSALAEAGLEEVNAAGKTFDATLHEAISQQESADVPEGNVIQQVRKGYKLRDRLLRPATVIVAKKPAGK
ncbi:MAG TPA: nucleotide exchange factor GrpE [Verrucomicrobiae bacterium]|nr:nucleotide exchange factor GrpE [Verrucomicrobiae bacterium]